MSWTSPVIADGVAYAGASDQFLYAIAGGNALWRTPLDGPIRTDFVPETCVPAWYDGRVYVGHMAGGIAAIDASTGVLAWQHNLPGRPSSPLRPAGGKLFLGIAADGSGGAICALNTDGSICWQFDTDSPVYSCPAFAAGGVFVTTGAGAVLALDAATGHFVWEHREAGDEFDTSVAVSKSGVFATTQSGKMICLDPQTGAFIRQWLSPTGNFTHSSPALGAADIAGEVFFGADDRSIYVVSSANARTIATHTTGGAVLGSPALSDDIAYIGSQDGTLYAIGPECHHIEPAYRMSTGRHISTSPAVGSGLVVFGGSDGCLYALEACAS